MLSSPDLSFSRTLPLGIFNQLEEVLQQMAQKVGDASLVVTEAVLARIRQSEEWQMQQFTVVISEQFSVLLVGKPEERGRRTEGEQGDQGKNPNSELSIQHSALNVSLTFNSEAIASFVSQLRDLFEYNSQTYQNLERYLQVLQPNDAALQCQFTLLLLEFLLSPQNLSETAQSLPYLHVSVCKPVEDALKKQLAQERLLNRVTTQIRQSLDLSVIMTTAIEQVREFLALDRLVICEVPNLRRARFSGINHQEGVSADVSSLATSSKRLNLDTFNHAEVNYSLERSVSSISEETDYQEDVATCVIYEARATDAIASVLNYTEKNCFAPNSHSWEKYRHGFTLVVDDVEKTYAQEDSLLEFLREMKVRSKLVTPIVFQENLWGLVIAHQCDQPRHWTESEKNLLTSIAEQLAIAIYQAQLMRSLTQEKQNLEERVIERTMALRDALVVAEAASRLRSEFLATMSHELLTPLTYVIGMSSTLLRWPLGELSQRQRDYLQRIHDCGEHLLEMINDILDLSQIEAGKAVLNFAEFSLVNLAESTLKSLMENAQSQHVNLKLDLLIDPVRDRFNGDIRRVEQILWNLLSNAIKFTPEGGDVTLRIWIEDSFAVFQIEDTGIGIPEEQLPKLFEKFQQLDTSYRRRYGGTGLGLALTKQLVELHRGRIEVESTVGIGSIFTVWLPT